MSSHIKVVYNYVCIRVKSNDDIQDIIQETMLAVWSSLKSFGNSSSFKTWLIGITRRKICDHYRVAYKIPTLSFSDVGDFLMVMDDSDRMNTAIDVNNAVMTLSSTEQELVFLVFNVQLTYQEISEITQIPVGTVKSRMSTIKAKLRKHLEKE